MTTVTAAIVWSSCGGGGEVQRAEAPMTEVTEKPEEVAPERPRFVVVHRNTPIRLAPSDSSAYFQYRTPERQKDLEARWAEDAAEEVEREKERLENRNEREAKRRERMRKRRRKLRGQKRRDFDEREKLRKERLRHERATDEIERFRKHAKKMRWEAADRWWIPFQVVGERDGWMEIRPVPANTPRGHCFQRNFGQLDRLDATYWIRTSDAATVVTRNVSVPVWAGTEVKLRPGVAVERVEGDSEKPLFRTYVNGFVLDLPIPPEALGDSYQPGNPFEAPVTDTVFTDIAFAERKLLIGKRTPFPYNPFANLYVTGTLRVDHRFYITTQTPCGEYTVRGDKDLIQPAGARGTTRLTADGIAVDPPYAIGGAVATTPDGERFGNVLVDFALGNEIEGPEGKSCWRTAIWGKVDAVVNRSVDLCFDPADVMREPQ